MTETVTRRVSQRHTGVSFSWHRQSAHGPSHVSKVCKFWLAGDCRRNPCRFAHPEVAAPVNPVLRSLNRSSFKQTRYPLKQVKVNLKAELEEHNLLKLNQKISPEKVVISNSAESRQRAASVNRVLRLNRSILKQSHPQRHLKANLKVENEVPHNFETKPNVSPVKKVEEKGTNVPLSGDCNAVSEGAHMALSTKICEYLAKKGSCEYGKECKSLHSWCYGDGFSMLAQLKGHTKVITGITLPLGSDKLFSCSKDGTVRVWNCHSGECISVADVGTPPVECLISEGPWVFAGLTNAVKVWNIETNAEFTLSGPAGQVYTMVSANGMLLAGVHDGSIFAWKFNHEASSFDVVTPLKGHTDAVTSLIVGCNRLYSGSLDSTIRVWDLETMLCIHTLAKHSEVVMSVLCWEKFLLSCSLDKTLKVWAATEAGELEVTFERKEEHGILSMCGMHDATNKPILLCSCNDNTVRLYELPSFVERGRIFAKQEVRAIHIGPQGLFFTGDGTGLVSVWRCSSDSIEARNESVKCDQ